MAYYNSGDYKLKYRWAGYDFQNRPVQLDILQKSSSSFTLTNIGGLQALRLSIQGGQSQISAPIVKTSLAITLIDAPDEIQEGYKFGGWEEFYTPDSTKYLVKLYRGSNLEWQGFITPDSWQESLDYRGSITLTARDNLGHLQDFEFDAAGDSNGLISIYTMLTTALGKIDFPMDLIRPAAGDARELRDTSGNVLLDSYVNVSRFRNDNWYTALEDVLEAAGYCLRYVGSSNVAIQPVRGLPLFGSTSRSGVLDGSVAIEFYGGERSNDPAYREIREKVDYEAEDEVSFDVFKNLTFSSSSESTISGCKYYKPSTDTWPTFNNRYWAVTGGSGGGWLARSGFLNADIFGVTDTLKAQDGEQALHLGVGLICGMPNNYGSTSIRPAYRIPAVGSTDVTLGFEFARPVTVSGRGTSSNPSANKVAPLAHYMKKAALYIQYTDPSTSTVYYWNGTNWQAAAFLLELDVAEDYAESYGFTIPLKDISDMATLGGNLDIEFANFYTAGETDPILGAFVRLTALKAKINARAVLKSDTITTINDPDYNVKVERRPVVGAMSVNMPVFRPGNYPGALWVYGTYSPKPYGYANYWRGFNSSTAIPLPAQIHKQLLCFNHISLTALGGTFGAVDKSDLLIIGGQDYNYKGKHYILQSGTLDVLTNRVSSAVLHEYIWYDDLFDETHNPTYAGVPTYDVRSGDGVVNKSGGSGGGGGGGGTGTVTSVALTMPTGFEVAGSPLTTEGVIAVTLASGYKMLTDTMYNEWYAAYNLRHSHDNKSVLDAITLSNWNSVYNSRHSHSNKTLLDGIGDNEIDEWNEAYDKAHSHSNKSVLDGITSTKVSNWDNTASSSHSHSNKSVLDGITSTKVSNWDTAAADAHTHSNKSFLDGIDTADQTFGGNKTFSKNVTVSQKMAAAALVVPSSAPSGSYISTSEWYISIDTSAISGSVV